MNKFDHWGRITKAAVLLSTFALSLPLHADMIGNVLTIERLFPDLNTTFEPAVSTTVAAGPSDATHDFNAFAVLDPEANAISIDWVRSSRYGGDSLTFDGFRFTGFSSIITNVTASDVTNISIADLAFSTNFITLNLGSSFDASSFIRLNVEFAPVPLPAALPLLGIAITGLGFMRRRAG